MNNQDIAVIINSFNRFSLLKEALGALSSWVPTSSLKDRVAVVIYDAGSTDGTIEWVKAEIPNFKFTVDIITPQPGDDTSFAAGLNAGVDYADGKYSFLKFLLFYETDNQILEETPLLHALGQLELRTNLGACGFTVRKHDGSPAGVGQPFPSLVNFALGKHVVQHFQLEEIKYDWQKSATRGEFSEVDVVYTSPLLVRLEAWKDTKGLDTNLFPFSDCDVDWAKRLYDLGWRKGVVKTDAVIHDNREALSAWSKSRAIQNHRGRLRYFKRHKPLGVLAVWPVATMLRHSMEFLAAKTLVKDPVRKEQLSEQFKNLLKTSPKSYK